jgi:hypothetical protein
MPSLQDLEDNARPDTPEEVEHAMTDTSREKEILGKAITGILILMLKWFRASRIATMSAKSNYRCIKIRVPKSITI